MLDQPDIRPKHADDVLEVGRRRRRPRWMIVVLWAAVAAAVIAVLATRGSSPRHSAGPTAGPSASGPALTEPLGGPVSDDLAIDGTALFRLSHGALYRTDVTDPQAPVADGVVNVGGLDVTLTDVSFHLVLDRASHRVWVVTYGAAPATVVAFDSRTLKQVRRLLWPSDVHSAAALGGHLYLAATNAVVDVPPEGADPATITALGGQYTDVVADPARSRLVLSGADPRSYLQTYLPATGAVSKAVRQSYAKIGLQVVDGTIWAGGFGSRGAVLARLDPRTLRPVAFSELAPRLGPGDLLVAAGTNVLWVRAAGDEYGLWCLDGRTGAQLQDWQYAGAVVSRHGAAFVAQRGGPEPLRLGTCTG